MHSEFSEFYQRNKKRWMGAGCWVLGRVLDNDVNDDAMEKLLPCNEASSGETRRDGDTGDTGRRSAPRSGQKHQ